MSFDTLAPYYRELEFVLAGGVLQRCRTAFIAETSNCRSALLLGEGPGRFLVELLQTCPSIEVTCVEQSPRMIQEARDRIRHAGVAAARVKFERCNALTWLPPKAAFDLIVTHFFLDCFRPDELERLVSRIAGGAASGARWLLSDFRTAELGWRRWRSQAALTLMYGFFRCATGLSASRLTPPDGFLQAGGFHLTERRLANFGLIHSDLWVHSLP